MSKGAASAVLCMLMTVQGLLCVAAPVGGGLEHVTAPTMGMLAPMGGATTWNDSLDDMSRVYVPPGGLIGVDIAGGEAHLLASSTRGWVASSVIECPYGLVFDYVLATVDAPGGSSVLLSVLNATKEPTEVGYANATILGFTDLNRTAVSLYGLSSSLFPKVRLQATLVANGSFKPRLLDWRMVFGPPDEWHDPFFGLDREESRGDLGLGNGSVGAVMDGTPDGLLGHFYDNRDLTGFKSSREHEVINYDWGSGSPSGLGSDTFSIMWEGSVEAPLAGQYTFYLRSDDGARLYLDGQRVIDKWVDQPATEHSTSAQLEAGKHPLKVEYYENSGSASCQLRWSGPGIARQIIPATALNGPVDNVLVSKLVTLPPGNSWDMLHVSRSEGAGGTIPVDVLDGSTGLPIWGYTGLTDEYVDISSLPPSQYGTLKLRAAWELTDLPTAPWMREWSLGWLPKGTWRERFDHTARVERLLGASVSSSMLTPVHVGSAPQLLIPSLRSDAGYSEPASMYMDARASALKGQSPMPLPASGASAVDVADVDGDGYLDVAFSVLQTGDSSYAGKSPLFLGSPLGWSTTPSHVFDTVGASHVLLRDLNRDGRCDVVFAQEQNGSSYFVKSALYLGRASGWTARPDVEFNTTGASDVDVHDLDGDGRLDLVFSCYKSTGTTTESMVFLQGASGFDGTAPSHRLQTMAATAVACGDLNGDGRPDLVFANSFAGGQTEINSYVYWGKAGGGYLSSPLSLPTVGAADIEVADVDVDGDLDVVFANSYSNTMIRSVPSYVYLNDGTGGFPVLPSAMLPTVGAVAVEAADLDGSGWTDLVFACQYNGTSFSTPSLVYLGGSTGWDASPNLALPTRGASDAVVARALNTTRGAYVSKPIAPKPATDLGAFHTLRWVATVEPGSSPLVEVIDARTWTTLASTPLTTGAGGWVLEGAFSAKEHPSIRVAVAFSETDRYGASTVDELWLNWTRRVRAPPVVRGLEAGSPAVLRMGTVPIAVDVTDEYDAVGELGVYMEARAQNATAWSAVLFGAPFLEGGLWKERFGPRADSQVGWYDIRVSVLDSDLLSTGMVEFPRVVEVLNNRPTAPVVRIDPSSPVTVTSLHAVVVDPSTDIDTGALSYHYTWYKDGALQGALVMDTVPSALTSRGENWSVEVRAFDGLDESLPGMAWTVIVNAPPQMRTPLPSPEIPEDTVDDQWIDLGKAFEDPDGDLLTYRVDPTPEHIQVIIDGATGKVTLRPAKDWNGQESITFHASDGSMSASQTALVTVTAVNDRPRFTTVNGQPITVDPVVMGVDQGQQMTITIGATDVEGDELVFSVNTTAVTVDEATGTITFEPGNDEVGTLRFALIMYDVATPSAKVTLNFTINVVNRNDPMEAPRIVNPPAGSKFKAGTTFSLIGVCTDPDTQYGQRLTFTWRWNGTNTIGEGTSLTWNFTAAGTYNITLTVSDGEFSKEAWVLVTIEPKDIPTPPPPPPPDDDGDGGIGTIMVIGILVVLVVIGGVLFLVMSRRREQRIEAAEVAEEQVDERQAALRRMAAAVKATADAMEMETGKATLVPKAGGVQAGELEEVTIEQKGPGGEVSVLTSKGMEEGMLTMKPKETEAASKETMALFKDMARTEAPVSAADQEQMRVDNLKRKYATAIGRMPYGIPAPDLKGMDWNDLAAALATGEKRTLPDGHETTRVKGKWYYSDPGDSSTFLKEHGAKPKAEPRRAGPAAAPPMDKSALLAKLEERFILGEISESVYRDLKKKFETGEGSGPKAEKEDWIEE